MLAVNLSVNSAKIPLLENGDHLTPPAAVIRIKGGNSRIDEDDYIAGAPELIVEVSGSSVSQDMNDKSKAYRRNGVQEYLVWQVAEKKVVCFSLKAGDYLPLIDDEEGIIRSEIFPGLWLEKLLY